MNKTDREDQILAAFQNHNRGVANIVSARRQPEPASDFVCTLDSGQRIGLEITNLVSESLAQATSYKDALREELLKGLNSKRVVRDVHVYLHEYHARALARPDTRAKTCDRIVEAASQTSPSKFDECVVIRTEALRQLGIDYVEQLLVWGAPEPGVSMVFSAGPQYATDLQAAIDRKNCKVTRYREELEGCEQWLVLGAGTSFEDGSWISGNAHIGLTSSFDRTFFVDASRGLVVELNPQNSFVAVGHAL
ncbi:MAG: hypothetical protein IPK60_09350 [Sandaracinaceae bacterium]|nr:hypothetical protein [Sandaracinaceae bacterium]